MHFCSECGNMYYIRIFTDGDDKSDTELRYYCRKCGHTDTLISEDNVVVSKTNIKYVHSSFHNIINKYTKLDPTLPHTNTIKCPSASCVCNTDDEIDSDVIYMRYNEKNMNYVYLCTHCDTIWNN